MTKEDLEPLIDNLKNDYQKMTLKELEQKYNTPYWIILKLFKKYNIKDVKRENKLKKHIVERINKEYTIIMIDLEKKTIIIVEKK